MTTYLYVHYNAEHNGNDDNNDNDNNDNGYDRVAVELSLSIKWCNKMK